MREYARKMKVRYDHLSFKFDGVALDPQQTPADLDDMEEGDCIDVVGL